MKASQIHSHLPPARVKPLVMAAAQCADYAALSALGLGFRPQDMAAMSDWAMDSLQPSVTVGSLETPVQFLQQWLPGFVRVMTAARKIDELIGITTTGSWEDEEIVQGILEPLGEAELYGDYTNIPLSSYNTEFARRTVIRFEKGLKVGVLEEARAGRIKVNAAAEKRKSAALALDIARNRIGFFGYNGGLNRTYGFLNDPSLPAYVTAANGASASPLWSTKTFLEITADLRGMIARLQIATQDTFDPQNSVMTLALATNVYQYLTITNVQGYGSVLGWLKETYPRLRVVSAPELNAANGGANVAYLYPDSIGGDDSTDDGAVWLQVVPAKFQTIGVEKQAKAYVEDYSNATAGVLVKRPFAIQRLTGI
jgi:hypothetical protein